MQVAEMVGRFIGRAGRREIERRESELDELPSRRMFRPAVHQYPSAVLRQQQGGKQEPGQAVLLSGVCGPIEIDGHGGQVKGFPGGTDQSGQLLRRLAHDPHEAQKGAQLDRFDRVVHDHSPGLGRLKLGQMASEPRPLAEGANEWCEGVLRGGIGLKSQFDGTLTSKQKTRTFPFDEAPEANVLSARATTSQRVASLLQGRVL